MTEKMSRKQMNEIRDEIDRLYNLMDDPSWDENTTAMWAMSEEIVRLRNELAEQAIIHEVQKTNTVSEIERLRAIIQDIANAVTDEGRKPGYHKQQVNYVRTMWFPLYEAISKAVKEMDNGTGKP